MEEQLDETYGETDLSFCDRLTHIKNQLFLIGQSRQLQELVEEEWHTPDVTIGDALQAITELQTDWDSYQRYLHMSKGLESISATTPDLMQAINEMHAWMESYDKSHH